MQGCELKHKQQLDLYIVPHVTPHAGVWIETIEKLNKRPEGVSPLMQGCELKQIGNCIGVDVKRVTPHAGVWIETISSMFSNSSV